VGDVLIERKLMTGQNVATLLAAMRSVSETVSTRRA
jgi:hypothetical protein